MNLNQSKNNVQSALGKISRWLGQLSAALCLALAVLPGAQATGGLVVPHLIPNAGGMVVFDNYKGGAPLGRHLLVLDEATCAIYAFIPYGPFWNKKQVFDPSTYAPPISCAAGGYRLAVDGHDNVMFFLKADNSFLRLWYNGGDSLTLNGSFPGTSTFPIVSGIPAGMLSLSGLGELTAVDAVSRTDATCRGGSETILTLAADREIYALVHCPFGAGARLHFLVGDKSATCKEFKEGSDAEACFGAPEGTAKGGRITSLAIHTPDKKYSSPLSFYASVGNQVGAVSRVTRVDDMTDPKGYRYYMSLHAGTPYSKGSADGDRMLATFSNPLLGFSNGPVWAYRSLMVADENGLGVPGVGGLARLISSTTDKVHTIAGSAGNFGYLDGKGSGARFAQKMIAVAMSTLPFWYPSGHLNFILEEVAPGVSVIRQVASDGTVTTVSYQLPEPKI